MIDHGATTIWELWNGDTADPAMNSGNHVMLLGDLLLWYYEDLAGIRNADGAVGYHKITMAPCFPEELHHVKAWQHTASGKVSSEWTRQGDNLSWQIEIPANTTAVVSIPSHFGIVPPLGNGIHSVTEQDDKILIEVGSGKYSFVTP
jgi:alpha-L-rhamnosidase